MKIIITLSILLLTANQVQASDDWDIQLNVTPTSGNTPLTVSVQATIVETNTPAILDSTSILGAWNYTGNRPDGVTRHGTMNFSSGNVFSYTLVDADNQSNGSGTGNWTLSGSTLTLDAALTGSATVSGNPTTFNYSGHGTFVFTR